MKTILTAVLVQMALTSAALAVGPAELSMSRGALVVDDQVLFVSDGAGDPCKTPCSAIPFLASAESSSGGLWTVVQTEAGLQWAYDGAPLYLWPEIGDDYGEHFFGFRQTMTDYYGLRPAMIRDVIAEGLAISVDDVRVVSRPFIDRRTMAAYSLGNDASGTVIVMVCVDHTGRAGQLQSPARQAPLPLTLTPWSSLPSCDISRRETRRVKPSPCAGLI